MFKNSYSVTGHASVKRYILNSNKLLIYLIIYSILQCGHTIKLRQELSDVVAIEHTLKPNKKGNLVIREHVNGDDVGAANEFTYDGKREINQFLE